VGAREKLAGLAARAFEGLFLSFLPGLAGPSRGVKERWRAAARAAGLARVQEDSEGVAGWAGPFEVRLTRYEDRGSSGTRIRVSGPGMPCGLTIRPEGLATRLRAVRGTREVETGHEVFDAKAWIEGDSTLARAVLGSEARRAIGALFDGRLDRSGRSPFFATGAVEDGVLRVDVADTIPREPASPLRDEVNGLPPAGHAYLDPLSHLPDVLSEVLALARRLGRPCDLAQRLADNLKTEPVAGVRRLALLTLAREFAAHPGSREALRAALLDPDAEVRLQAGIVLGAEGRETLVALAAGEGAEDATTAGAVVALGWHLTLDQSLAVLRHALRTRREGTARACLLALGRRRGQAAIGAIGAVLAVEGPGLAVAAAEALGEGADAAAEAPLVGALASPFAAVRSAAARSLGRVGTTAAVAPLKALEARDSAARVAARQAVAQIQARARGAAPGQLSLAGAESGALSLADGEAGRVSLADEGGRRAPPAGAE
jgi:HEAT repeat protein